MRVLDLFAGQLGWSKAFLARGWEVVAIDLVEPAEIPQGCTFIKADILECSFSSDGKLWYGNFSTVGPFDFICASSPCEEFSVHGMKMFHPNPPYPASGVRLFNHTRAMCEESGVPYVMENVRAAEAFVGKATHKCGPFHLWGTGVPPLMIQGVKKGMDLGSGAHARGLRGKELHDYRKNFTIMWAGSGSPERKAATAKVATIPPELANCVAEYAGRILEAGSGVGSQGPRNE